MCTLLLKEVRRECSSHYYLFMKWPVVVGGSLNFGHPVLLQHDNHRLDQKRLVVLGT